MGKQKIYSIKRQLLLLVLSAVLPVLIFSIALVGYVAIQQARALDTSLMSTTRALSAAIDGEISNIESNLQMLSVLEDFNASQMPDLYRRLRRFVNSQEGWSSISLANLDGTSVMNTIRHFGEITDGWEDQEFFKEVIIKKRPTVSGFRIGKFSKQKVFSVAVPVKVRGEVSLILIGTVHTSLLANQLKRQNLPESWTGAILDKNGLIIARSRDHDLYAGTKATNVLFKKTAEVDEAFFRDSNKDGLESFGSFKKSSASDWAVVIGMPKSESHLPSMKILWMFLSGGTLLMLIGILISRLISNQISRSVMSLSASAQSLGRGEPLPMIDSSLKEVNNVAEALRDASLIREESDKVMKDLYVKAQEAVELRDSFLSVASHELKTPLTTLNLQAEILARSIHYDFSPAKVESAVSRMLNQLKRLTNLIDDLLDITKINAGKLEMRLEKADFVKIAQDILANFEIESRGIELDIKTVKSLEGNFDRNRLEQIFTNLVSNSIKYGLSKPIIVSVYQEDDFAVFKIQDQGLGIESKNITKIFERFERVVDNNNIRGLGLGLWIVKRIVEHLGGTIEVQSPGLNLGSTFTVKIPIKNS